jgi:hypothetical protein
VTRQAEGSRQAITPERAAQIERDLERKAIRAGLGGSFTARGPEGSRGVRYDVLAVHDDRIVVKIRGTKIPVRVTRSSRA